MMLGDGTHSNHTHAQARLLFSA